MGFISFNEKYYCNKLRQFEDKHLNAEELFEVKRLLKVLDDLDDEGYTALSADLESKFCCISKLRAILARHGEVPFPVFSKKPKVRFEDKEIEAHTFLKDIIAAKSPCADCDGKFLQDLKAYCNWIGYDDDTAYVFLLRDAFLPYAYYVLRGRSALYPWVIGRDFLNQVAKNEHADDEFRLPVYEALENGYTQISAFAEYIKERMRESLRKYPMLRSALQDLLVGISEEKICVVESGYCGTIPMLLSALDERVDFKLYTTAPFLYETYKDKIFCPKYEDLRKFETMYSQEYLFKFSSFRGKFYVKTTSDSAVIQKALGEIYSMTK